MEAEKSQDEMAERIDNSSGNDVETTAAPVDPAPVAALPNEARDDDVVTLKTWIVVVVCWTLNEHEISQFPC